MTLKKIGLVILDILAIERGENGWNLAPLIISKKYFNYINHFNHNVRGINIYVFVIKIECSHKEGVCCDLYNVTIDYCVFQFLLIYIAKNLFVKSCATRLCHPIEFYFYICSKIMRVSSFVVLIFCQQDIMFLRCFEYMHTWIVLGHNWELEIVIVEERVI